MHKMLLDIPDQLETNRLLMRGYRPGDGPWSFAMSQRNREHLLRYEAQNPAVALKAVRFATAC